MTTEEAIRSLRFLASYEEIPKHPREVFETAIEALEEVEQYRALGTVEELKEAKEKQIPKKPIVEKPICGDCGDRVCGYCQGEFANRYICSCGRVWKGFPRRIPYCDVCGQAIDWSDK